VIPPVDTELGSVKPATDHNMIAPEQETFQVMFDVIAFEQRSFSQSLT